MELESGSVYAGYRIVREIGRGGMAVVYEAVHEELKRSVALKVLPDMYAASEEATARFRREAEAGARLQHPNIVQVYEAGNLERTLFIAMEFVRGRTLAQFIDEARVRRNERTPPDPRATPREGTTDRAYIEASVKLIVDVLRGLQHAHDNGVLHRDIKPQNLLLDEEGRVRIADFGLARVLADPAFSRTGEIRGTPWYMSPEQVAVSAVPIDHRTDIFSTAVTLYETLTLERPFPGTDVTAVFRQILHRDPPSMRTLNPRLPRDLETIVLRALEKEADRRYATAAEFADDLERFLNYESIMARPVGPVGRAWRRVLRHKALAGVAAALVLTLIGVAIVVVRNRMHTARRVETLLARAAGHREAGAYDREAEVLERLLADVDPDQAEARRRLEAAERSRRTVAAGLVARAAPLLLEQRYDLARMILERALRLVPADPTAVRLLEEAGGVRTVVFRVEEGPARVYASEYVQLGDRFEEPVLLGRGDPVEARLRSGDYLVAAIADDGRFVETWVAVDPWVRDSEFRLAPRAGSEALDGMADVPAGSFDAGTDDLHDVAAWPRHEVAVEEFRIDVAEATNERYDRYLRYLAAAGRPGPRWLSTAWKDGTLDPSRAGEPVYLDWAEACRFLAFEGKRLPTEAEWEAAAGGRAGRAYPWGDAWDPARVALSEGPAEAVRVHGGEGYAYGLYDMIGNAPEWTASRFTLYQGFDPRAPLAAAEGSDLPTTIVIPKFDRRLRVVRGVWMVRPPPYSRASRFGCDPRHNLAGVRGVRSVRPRGGVER